MKFIHQNLVSFLYKFFEVTIESDFMMHNLQPILLLTVSNGLHQKTVYAIIDSGSFSSYITPELANELKLISTENENNMYHNVKVSELGSKSEQPSNDLYLICKPIPRMFSLKLPLFLAEKISRLLNITLHNLSDEFYVSIIIGANEMTRLLMPRTNPSPKCISLTPNISAIETPLGYYLQGFQSNYHTREIVANWKSFGRMFSFVYWKWFFACILIVDLILAFALIF